MSSLIFEHDQMISGRMQDVWHGQADLQEEITLENLYERLGWEVFKQELSIPTGEKTGEYSLVREVKNPDGTPKRIILAKSVSEGYNILQNSDMIRKIEPLLEAGCKIDVEGSIKNGEHAWVLLRLSSDIVVGKNDVIKKYILATTDHSGHGSAKFGPVGIRVVCANTLNAATESTESRLLSITHKGDVTGKLEAAVQILDTVNGQFLALSNKFNELASIGFSTFQLRTKVKEIFFPNLTLEQESAKRDIIVQRQDQIENLFLTGPGSDLDSAKGTAYGAYQAINNFLNHETKGDAEQRAASLTWGQARKTDERALQLLSV